MANMGFVLNQIIGDYECLGIIDKPRAGVTYKVRNRTTGEIEALRALPGETSRDANSSGRLLREIRIQARLSHPNLIAFHDAFEIDGCLVMTTEFVEAPTLAELCAAGPLGVARAVEAVTQVLDGLEEAHALGIVHRNISAQHVMAGVDGVKLGGFDLAKSGADDALTQVGTSLGDPRYISPEQVRGQSALDARSDLYSVGVLLYQTLTGSLPFEAASDFEILAAQLSTEPQPPSAVNPAVPAALDPVVLKALRKNPAERFDSAQEFRAALAAAAGTGAPVLNRPPAASAAQPVQRNSRRPLSAAMLCGVLFLVIGVAVVSWMAMH
jgi:serine/threonine protein kinase